jgi:hypothetical protein
MEIFILAVHSSCLSLLLEVIVASDLGAQWQQRNTRWNTAPLKQYITPFKSLWFTLMLELELSSIQDTSCTRTRVGCILCTLVQCFMPIVVATGSGRLHDLLNNPARIHVPMKVDPRDAERSRGARAHERRATSTRYPQSSMMVYLPPSHQRERTAPLNMPIEGASWRDEQERKWVMLKQLEESCLFNYHNFLIL